MLVGRIGANLASARGRGVFMKSMMLGLLLVSAPAGAFPQPPGLIWASGRDAILAVPCPPGGDTDETCRAIAMRRGSHSRLLGSGYAAVSVLWHRGSGPAGPDVLVRGDSGGSGGLADLFAVTFAPNLVVRRLHGERLDDVTAHPGSGRLRLDLPFDIEFFNGAPHAGVTIVPLPVRWSGGDFSLDLAALTRDRLTPQEMDFRVLAVGSELHQWAEDNFPTPKLYPPEASSGTPVAVQALAELILSGHAEQARILLHRTWPRDWDSGARPLGGEEYFWASLCAAMVRHPFWTRFGLDRLPHADFIKVGAAKAAVRR